MKVKGYYRHKVGNRFIWYIEQVFKKRSKHSCWLERNVFFKGLPITTVIMIYDGLVKHSGPLLICIGPNPEIVKLRFKKNLYWH